jgi:hypothetical protein
MSDRPHVRSTVFVIAASECVSAAIEAGAGDTKVLLEEVLEALSFIAEEGEEDEDG